MATCLELTAAVRWELAEVATLLPLQVRCVGVVRFERRVSVLAGVQRRVWEAVAGDSSRGSLNPLHEAGRWSPHITLGRTRRAGAFADHRIDELLPAPPLLYLTTLRSFDTETGALEVLEPRS